MSKQPPVVPAVGVPVGGVEGEGPVTVVPVVINKYVPLKEVSAMLQITDTDETTLVMPVPVPPPPKVEVGPSSYSPEVYISPSLLYLYHPNQHTSNMLYEGKIAPTAQSAEPAKPTAPSIKKCPVCQKARGPY